MSRIQLGKDHGEIASRSLEVSMDKMKTPRSSPTKFTFESPYSVTEEISLPPFHPSQFDQPMISSDPDKFHSHFIKLRSPNKKGQARYRCVTCFHEFECTGKLRLIQHIVGPARSGNQSKNVRSCAHPYEPLKLALLELPESKLPITPRAKQTSSLPATHRTVVPKPLLPELTETMIPITSTTSSDSILTIEPEYRNEFNEFTSLFSVTEDDLLSVSDIEKTRDLANSVTPSKRSRNEDMISSTPPPLAEDASSVHSNANQALIQFFSNYRLPVTAVEDPLFLELLSAIRVAGPSYRPSMISLLQDTQMIEKTPSSQPSPRDVSSSIHNQTYMSTGTPQYSPRQQLQPGNVFSVSEPNLRSSFFDYSIGEVPFVKEEGKTSNRPTSLHLPSFPKSLRPSKSLSSLNFSLDHHQQHNRDDNQSNF